MKSQTSLVAEQTRLNTWADQIRSCQSRPKGMKVETWCQQNGMTKANYYYRLRRVRQAYLDHARNQDIQLAQQTSFIEMPLSTRLSPKQLERKDSGKSSDLVAVLRGRNNLSLEIYSSTSPELMKTLIGAISYAQ